MTGSEALAIHAQVQELLRQQAALFDGDHSDLDQAELLSTQITSLLDEIPLADQLTEIDDALRAQLLASAQLSITELAVSTLALDRLRQHQREEQVRSERDGAALRRYLPLSGGEPAHFLDERR